MRPLGRSGGMADAPPESILRWILTIQLLLLSMSKSPMHNVGHVGVNYVLQYHNSTTVRVRNAEAHMTHHVL